LHLPLFLNKPPAIGDGIKREKLSLAFNKVNEKKRKKETNEMKERK
jgi:hypothetical protein